MDSIMEVLSYKFHYMFMEEFPKYADNKMALRGNPNGNFIEISAEKLENCDEEAECEHDNSAGSLDDMLKGIEGIESADDHVERLADDLRNKRGGQA